MSPRKVCHITTGLLAALHINPKQRTHRKKRLGETIEQEDAGWLATFLIQFRTTCLGIGADHRGLVLPISVNNYENQTCSPKIFL